MEDLHRDFGFVDAEAVGDALGEVLEDLLDGELVFDDELVVQRVEEGDLDEGCAIGFGWDISVWRLDAERKLGGNSSGSIGRCGWKRA